MKTLTKSIIECTGMHSEEYDKVIFKTYLTCICKVSKNPQHLQTLLINKPINKWFLTQVEKVNKEFLKDVIPFLKLRKEVVKAHYKRTIDRVTSNYPKVLINAVPLPKGTILSN